MPARKSRGSRDLACVHTDEADDNSKGHFDIFFSDLFSFCFSNSTIMSDTRRERQGQTAILTIYFRDRRLNELIWTDMIFNQVQMVLFIIFLPSFFPTQCCELPSWCYANVCFSILFFSFFLIAAQKRHLVGTIAPLSSSDLISQNCTRLTWRKRETWVFLSFASPSKRGRH